MVFRENLEAAEEALALVAALAPGAKIVRGDIARPTEVQALLSEVHRDTGPVTVLINNAYRGGRAPKKTHEVAPEDWMEDLATNLTGHFLMTRACLPSMLEENFGRIVFVGSLAMRGEPGRVAYSCTKGGLMSLSATIAGEYAKHGITSNVVNPGFIATGVFNQLSQQIQERALRSVPSRRAGAPSEVAAAVAYLVSDEAAYTTGQVMGVDGGAR